MAGVRNLAQVEAVERARLLDVTGYDITLDLTDGTGGPGEDRFRSTTRVAFNCTEPGAGTFIEVAAEQIRSATLNGSPVALDDWSAERGLSLPELAASNELVVDADFSYSTSGQGLHRSVDPVDKEVYLYSQFETADAQRVFACFDQPDLKSVYAWHVTVPGHWRVISNMPVEREEPAGSAGIADSGAKTVHFGTSARMSTYITAVCAGPYHAATEQHGGIELGVYCRQSMKRYLDAGDIFLITKQGFDFYQEQFGVAYPLPKYDQVFVPEFNAGAMENFGCIVHAEQHYIFRSQVTDYEYENRANTILHEMAHMWFGDLVTMRWWDDLWLNESFAEWASHWCNSRATRFTDAWTSFLSSRKNWGYWQDQLSSTHPIYCEIPDVAAVEVNFDGITYAKGASVIKQLVAYVGEAAFLAGLREYFAKHAWGNATFDDLLAAAEAASGTPLRKFAAQWLETAQVNTLRPEVATAADGTYESVAVRQEAPAEHPTLRTHRIAVGLYDLRDGGMHRRERLEIEIAGELTEIPALRGAPVADALLLNDDDLSYAKLRLDERSLSTVMEHIGGFESSLTRALVWAATWDMVRDAEWASGSYFNLALAGLPVEHDVNLVTSILRQVTGALTHYADPERAPDRWAQLAGHAYDAVRGRGGVPAGSGLQLAWARSFASAAAPAAVAEDKYLGIVREWLAGSEIPAGLSIDTELRWRLLQSLVAGGAAGEPEIQAELERDRTAGGERQAAVATGLIATPEAKAETWRRLTSPQPLPNWLQRALLSGFQHPAQTALTQPYVRAYFDVVEQVWATRDSEPAQEFVELGYPSLQVSEATLAATDEWLAAPDRPGPLRRLVAEGRDGVVRALAGRARDAAEHA
ncbi:MAG: aminopeptidase N [Micromonosporaceae bacterium]|nr:aminopeptidase N [Micromonosporaceae bacterium]